MHFRNAASIIALVLITACAPQPVTLETPITALLPTLEILPSHTATPSVTPTESAVPLATPTVTAIPMERLYVDLLSPDGTFRLQSYDLHKYEIIDSYGMVIWSFIKDKGRVNAETTSFWIPMHIQPLSWSPDGKNLFLAASQSEDNSSTKYYGNTFADADEIFRFDLETGEMIALVPGQIHGYYAVAFSPDASQMVYANQTETPVRMKLLDLTTMEAKTLFVAEEKILEIGSFGWSPGMTQLLFSTLEFETDKENGNKSVYNIYIMNLASMEIRKIVENTDIYLNFTEWKEPSLVSYRGSSFSQWLLDINTGELSKINLPNP